MLWLMLVTVGGIRLGAGMLILKVLSDLRRKPPPPAALMTVEAGLLAKGPEDLHMAVATSKEHNFLQGRGPREGRGQWVDCEEAEKDAAGIGRALVVDCEAGPEIRSFSAPPS